MQNVVCALCGSGTASPVFTAKERDWGSGDEFKLVKYGKCGLVYVNPRPTAEELKKYYPSENWGRAKNRTEIEKASISGDCWSVAASERVRKITALGFKGKVLDVGCGDGFLLLYLARLGWDCYGVEPGEIAAAYAREVLKLKVFTGTLEKAAYSAAFFDVVNFHHVFEHLPYPAGTLAEVGRVLKREGYLVISVPNFDSLDCRLFGNKWVGLKPPQHLFQYTKWTLGGFLEKSGFKVCNVSYRSYEAKNTMYYSESFRYCLQDLGLYPLKKAVSREKPAPAAEAVSEAEPFWKRSLHFAERGVFKSIGFFADRLGCGSSMTIVARKA